MRNVRSVVIAILWLFAVPCARASGQAPCQTDASCWISVREPRAWNVGRASYTLNVGQQLRITGQAHHPRGVQAVLVNDRRIEIATDGGGATTFDVVVTAIGGMKEIVITAEGGGDKIRERYPVTVIGADVRQPTFVGTVLLPGSGQFRTGQSALGFAVLGASVGAVAAGVLWKETTIQCATRTSECAEADILPDGVSSSRPYLVPGVGAAVAISVLGALQARRRSNRADAPAGEASAGRDAASRLVAPAVRPMTDGIAVEWLRVKF
jgi:hypothetical protein